MLSWLFCILKQYKIYSKNAADDPWLISLERLKGRVGGDGVERISTQTVFDVLEIPMAQRGSLYRRLAESMRSLGWSPIRARGLTPGGFKDMVRGYARGAPGHRANVKAPLEF